MTPDVDETLLLELGIEMVVAFGFEETEPLDEGVVPLYELGEVSLSFVVVHLQDCLTYNNTKCHEKSTRLCKKG